MFIHVMNTSGEDMGMLNLDRLDLVKPTSLPAEDHDELKVRQGTTNTTFHISHSDYLQLMRYLDRYGIM